MSQVVAYLTLTWWLFILTPKDHHQRFQRMGSPSITFIFPPQQHSTAVRQALHICAVPGGPGRFSGHVAPPEAERKHQLTSARSQINRGRLAANQDAAQDTINHLPVSFLLRWWSGKALSLCYWGYKDRDYETISAAFLAPATVIVHILLLRVSLKFSPSPKCDTLICAPCPSALLISSSFFAPSILLLHQVPELRADLSHLGSVGEVTAGQEVHRQPIGTPFSSRCQGGKRSKLLTAVVVVVVVVVGGGRSLQLPFLPEEERSNFRLRDWASLRSTDQPDWNQSCPVTSAPMREFITTLSQSVVYIKLD